MVKAWIPLIAVLSFGIVLGSVVDASAKNGINVKLHNGWRVTPAGDSIQVGDLLAGGVVSPNGSLAAFVSAGQGVHKLYILSGKDGRLLSTTNLGRAWSGVAWSLDSKTLYVSGGTAPVIHVCQVDDKGQVELMPKIPMEGFSQGTVSGKTNAWLGGMAMGNDGRSLYVTNIYSDQLLKVDVEKKAIVEKVKYDGGAAPYAVAFSPRTGRLFVTLQATGRVVQVDPNDLSEIRSAEVGRHPNSMLVVKDRLFVACGNDDHVAVLDERTLAIQEKILTRPWPDAPPGSTPNALAATPDGSLLFVANADNNCVAQIDIARRGASVVEGFIPSGAYTTAVTVLPNGKTLVIGSGKGVGTGPNGRVPEGGINPVAPAGLPYIVTLLNGLLSRVEIPDEREIKNHTAQVLANSPYRDAVLKTANRAPRPGSNPVPSRVGDPSPIQHVLYIIKENRTYDQLFGDLKDDQGNPIGNGDPRLTLFGEDVAPNHRRLARDYVLFDNLYCDGEVSVDGHHWTNGAYVPNYMQRVWPQQYSGKGTARYTAPLQATPSGRIWDMAREAGLSYRTYYYHTRDNANEEWAAARGAGRRDYDYVDVFIKEFREFESTGKMPRLMVMALSEDHTSGTRAGSFTPKACVASNDLGIGKIVEAISSSSLWAKFAIFIIEDDAQNGPDHVDAHRTVGLVVSPYTKRKAVDSTHYTTTSMLRSMELILGLKPMSQFDAAATPMYRAFSMNPDMTPYRALTPKQDLQVKNPARPQNPLLASIDFSEPDQLNLAQEIELNRDIWHSVKGPNVPYPGATRRFGTGAAEDED